MPSPSASRSAAPALLPATLEDDAALLGPWTAAFAALCGEPVRLAAIDPSVPAAGQRMTFPRVFTPIELIGSIGHIRHSPVLLQDVRRLGFDWDEDGRIMTVPAPGAFNAHLAAYGGAAGFALCCAKSPNGVVPLGMWLLRYMEGVMTVAVNAPEFYAAVLHPDRPGHLRDDARWGLLSVAHDLSVHALNYHRIPHAAVADLAARIRVAVPQRCASWSEPTAVAPLTLTYFYDNDLNRYTYAVWCRCQRSQDFAAVFTAKRNYDQLLAALDVRLAETRAGRGDVASGDFDDMGRLTETSFDVQ